MWTADDYDISSRITAIWKQEINTHLFTKTTIKSVRGFASRNCSTFVLIATAGYQRNDSLGSYDAYKCTPPAIAIAKFIDRRCRMRRIYGIDSVYMGGQPLFTSLQMIQIARMRRIVCLFTRRNANFSCWLWPSCADENRVKTQINAICCESVWSLNEK